MLPPDLPAQQGVKIPFFRVKSLVFYTCQSKANGQHSKGEDEEASHPKHSSPGTEPVHGSKTRTIDRTCAPMSPRSPLL